MSIKKDSVVFIASGATAGAGVSATIGTMGLVGGFGGVAIGMTPVTAAGTVAGAATYGAFKAIENRDALAFGAVGIGAVAGAKVSSTIGGMGLAGSFGAVGIGMGTMAAAGGVVGLGVYGLYQACKPKSQPQYGLYEAYKPEPKPQMVDAVDAFGRMEDKILEMEANTQAMLELDPVFAENHWHQTFANLDIEDELEALKAQQQRKAQSTANSASGHQFSNHISTSDATKNYSVKFTHSPTPNAPLDKQSVNLEHQAKIVHYEPQPCQNWKCLKSIPGHRAKVTAIAISSDGQTLASGSEDKTVSLWNLRTGKLKFTFFGQEREVFAVAICPQGKMLVAGGFDKKITRWKLETKALQRLYLYPNSSYNHSGFISCLTFSPDQTILASASGDQTIRLWDGYTGEFQRTLNGHSDIVWSVAISPDGKTLVSGSADQTIRIWSLSRYQQTQILTGHSKWVTSVAISPDGNSLASGSADGTVKLWNLTTGELWQTLEGKLKGIVAVAISPDGQLLASGDTNTVQLWHLHTGQFLGTLAGCSPVVFSPDGQLLVTGGKAGTIKIWQRD
ncbi:hypothetical protein [Coleofasciculus sp. E1-EBD-02]|uniref:hypothetical protein n=1 Tax=Coleofasciculus sp. E1-EBD-02 TaxID=3068481 RepID=UPI0032FDA907